MLTSCSDVFFRLTFFQKRFGFVAVRGLKDSHYTTGFYFHFIIIIMEQSRNLTHNGTMNRSDRWFTCLFSYLDDRHNFGVDAFSKSTHALAARDDFVWILAKPLKFLFILCGLWQTR